MIKLLALQSAKTIEPLHYKSSRSFKLIIVSQSNHFITCSLIGFSTKFTPTKSVGSFV
jgi:hypothetical protein